VGQRDVDIENFTSNLCNLSQSACSCGRAKRKNPSKENCKLSYRSIRKEVGGRGRGLGRNRHQSRLRAIHTMSWRAYNSRSNHSWGMGTCRRNSSRRALYKTEGIPVGKFLVGSNFLNCLGRFHIRASTIISSVFPPAVRA